MAGRFRRRSRGTSGRVMHRALLLLPLLLVSGCGSGAQDPQRAALAFAQAIAAHDGEKACSLIAPATRSELESSQDQPCSKAILSQDVPSSTRVKKAEKYGTESRVVLDKDVVFMSRFSIGWRVIAALCKDRGEKLPYDCQISGA